MLAKAANQPYSSPMAFFTDVNPTGAIGDIVSVFRNAGPSRWRFLALAAATSFGIFYPIMQEEHRIPPRPPEVTYITSWKAGRSDAEIMRSNRQNQHLQDQLATEQAEREAHVHGIYRTIGKASGMDVDAIDRKADAERAAADAKLKAEGEAIRHKNLQGQTPHE